MFDFIENDVLRYGLFSLAVIICAVLLSSMLRIMIAHFTRSYADKLKADPTNFSFLKNSVSFVVFTLAIIVIFNAIPSLKSFGTALFAGAGIFAAIIGFASQKAFSNIISGIFILMFKPFRVGDTVEFGNLHKGIVEEITLRHTIIKNYESRRVIIPNNIISDETIINSNAVDTLIRKHVEFGISYDSDIDKAIEIIKEEVRKHPLFIDKRTPEEIKNKNEDVIVRVVALSDFSVNLKAYVWTDGNDNSFIIMTDLLKSVKMRFDKEGIEIPFPYRTVVYKKDLNEKNN